MIIKNIKVSGFERLYEGYKQCSKENYSGFGEDFLKFLNHNMIGIRLSEITTVELFYLKQIASSIKIISEEFSSIKNDSKEIEDISSGLLTLNSNIRNDKDITSREKYTDYILPIGCSLYDVLVEFKGPKITSVTGPMIDELYKDETGKISSKYIGNVEMEEKISKLFINNFYSFMASQMTKFDLVTNYLLNKKLYQYADDVCNLGYINSPFGEINFFGTNVEKLNAQIKSMTDNLYKVGMDCSDTIYFTFIVKSTIKNFLTFFFSTNYVIDFEPLSLVFTKEFIKIFEGIKDKYGVRIDSYISKLNTYKKNILNLKMLVIQL